MMKHKTLVVVEKSNFVRTQYESFLKMIGEEQIKRHQYNRSFASIETENSIVDIVTKSPASRGRRCHNLIYLAEKDEYYYEVFRPIVIEYRPD